MRHMQALCPLFYNYLCRSVNGHFLYRHINYHSLHSHQIPSLWMENLVQSQSFTSQGQVIFLMIGVC